MSKGRIFLAACAVLFVSTVTAGSALASGFVGGGGGGGSGVPTSRQVATSAPLTGGGTLASDLTISLPATAAPTLAGLTLTSPLTYRNGGLGLSTIGPSGTVAASTGTGYADTSIASLVSSVSTSSNLATVLVNGRLTDAGGAVQFLGSSGGGNVGISVGTISSSLTLKLPTAPATAGQLLTDVQGNGILSWTTVAGASYPVAPTSGTATVVGFGAFAAGPGASADAGGTAIGLGASTYHLGGGLGGASAVGFGANAPYDHSIALGVNATTTAAHQLVAGSSNGPNEITDLYFGGGPSASSPYTIHGVGGGDLTFGTDSIALVGSASSFALAQTTTGTPPPLSQNGQVSLANVGGVLEQSVNGAPWATIGGSGTLTPPATLTYAANNSNVALAISRVLTTSGNGAGDGLDITVGSANVDGAGASEESGLFVTDGTSHTGFPNAPRALIDTVSTQNSGGHGDLYQSSVSTGNGVTHLFRRARGTLSSLAAVQPGDVYANLLAVAYTGGSGDGCYHSAWITLEADAAGTFSTTSTPGSISFRAQPNGSAAGAIPADWSVRSTGNLVGGSGKVLGFSSNADSSANASLSAGMSLVSSGVIGFGGGGAGDTSAEVRAATFTAGTGGAIPTLTGTTITLGSGGTGSIAAGQGLFARASVGQEALDLRVSGDSSYRLGFNASGAMFWGNGTAGLVGLSSNSSGVLCCGVPGTVADTSGEFRATTITLTGTSSSITAGQAVLARASGGQEALDIRVSGDSFYRLGVSSDGTVNFGNGAAAGPLLFGGSSTATGANTITWTASPGATLTYIPFTYNGTAGWIPWVHN